LQALQKLIRRFPAFFVFVLFSKILIEKLNSRGSKVILFKYITIKLNEAFTFTLLILTYILSLSFVCAGIAISAVQFYVEGIDVEILDNTSYRIPDGLIE
jgi:hypothetical protein